MTIEDHPVSRVEWLPRTDLAANDWNPNRQAPPERRLLRVSILENGWTQPIVIREEPSGLQIVDGYHRWLTAEDDAVRALVGDDLVPIVRLRPTDPALARLATVRHNRARGTHHVLGMADIVADLLALDMSPAEIGKRLEMDAEEVDRLADRGQMTKRAAAAQLGNGWTPV